MTTLERHSKYTLQKVDAGELVEVAIPGWPSGRYTVQAKCGYDPIDPETGRPRPSAGQFVCVTHNVAFSDNAAKNKHLLSRVGASRSRKHRLAWWCWEHKAFEVP